ncbi:hypothetical protein [uncultured Mediterranean phage uvMED]|nr:hypothetical protein [uncultured Mediterranean phage uvMED]
MAYGLKYELFFTDVENNKFKIEIHQKDFIIDPFGLGTQPTQIIGTGNPVEIKWDADDDIYSPIIGSRCILNFFVTDTTVYDDFYKSGEREYKVKILEYTSFGSNWEDEKLHYNIIDQNWEGKLGSEVFYNPIWEGFIVNDGYKEAVVSAPYEIQLEAIDGLGTLESFDVPFPSDNANAKEKMFFYLKEILKLTGHEFQIYIANDVRKNGATANDTIFHDIEVDRYIFSNKNLILMDAKQALKHILLMTNSRIFQSFAKWYIVNNSSLIDNRIVQGTVAPSAGDVVNEPAAPVAAPVYSAPDITIVGKTTMIEDEVHSLVVSNTGSKVVTIVWTKPDNTTVTQNEGDVSFGIYFLGAVQTSEDGDTYSVTGTDANGNTDTASFTLDIDARTQSQDTTPTAPNTTPQPINFTLRLNISNSVTNAYISQVRVERNYTPSQVGDNFTMSFDVTSLTGEFTDASQITTLTTTYGSISKSLQGDFIRITVTGTLPDGGHVGTIVVRGAADVQQFSHSYTTNNTGLSNSSLSPTSESVTAGQGKTYSKTFSLTAGSGYKWQGSIGSAGGVTVISNSAIYDSITTSKTSDSNVNVVVNGTIGISSKTAQLTFSGSPIGSAPATSISLNPAPTYEIAQNSGYFDVSVTSNGNYRIEPDRSWLSFTPSTGVPGTQTVRVKFSANNRASTRSNSINFFPSGSNSVLLSAAVQQDGTA